MSNNPFGSKPSPFGGKTTSTTTAATGSKLSFGTSTTAKKSPFGDKPSTTSAFGTNKNALGTNTSVNTPAADKAQTAVPVKKVSWDLEEVEGEVLQMAKQLDSTFEQIEQTKNEIQAILSQKVKMLDSLTMKLHKRIMDLSTLVDRTHDDVNALKEEAVEISADASACERLSTSLMQPYGGPVFGYVMDASSSSSSPVTQYFQKLLSKFEKDLAEYRQVTQNLELAVTVAPAQTPFENAQALEELLKIQSQAFIELCAHVQHIHERVDEQADVFLIFYKNLPKSFNDPEDPFSIPRTIYEEDEEETAEMNTQSDYMLPKMDMRKADRQAILNILNNKDNPEAMQRLAFGASVVKTGIGHSSFGQKSTTPFGAQNTTSAFGRTTSAFGKSSTTSSSRPPATPTTTTNRFTFPRN
eukprot:m.74365 g.74365  ORF g.74365 m.74365 type:complete len:413 (-) comp8451_c0_seq3:1487-2725(-)